VPCKACTAGRDWAATIITTTITITITTTTWAADSQDRRCISCISGLREVMKKVGACLNNALRAALTNGLASGLSSARTYRGEEEITQHSP